MYVYTHIQIHVYIYIYIERDIHICISRFKNKVRLWRLPAKLRTENGFVLRVDLGRL